ncbi:MAG: segregation and condensation protein A [Phycisphaerales bacterium JB038]
MTNPTRTDQYTVRLENFEGPLDLLLYLIRRAEVEITEIPIATVTEQYLGFLEEIDQVNVEVAAEFLLMAATLVEIKSRVLQPPGEKTGDEETVSAEDLADPRSELIQQLLAYKRYRDAAARLDEKRRDWALRPPISARATDEEMLADARERMQQFELEDLHVFDLFEAFQNIIEAVDLSRTGEHQVQMDDTPIELHRVDMLDQLQRAGAPTEFRELFAGRTRAEMIGLFLALLDLVKDRRVLVRQDNDAQLVLELNVDPETDEGAPSESSDAEASGAAAD